MVLVFAAVVASGIASAPPVPHEGFVEPGVCEESVRIDVLVVRASKGEAGGC